MSKSLLLLLLSIFGISAFSQQVGSSASIPRGYERNSITVKFLDKRGVRHWSRAKPMVEKINFSDKYDNHNLSDLFLTPAFTAEVVLPGQIGPRLRDDLHRKNTGREILARWYNRQADGTMDMELVHHRGRFSATDADFLIASSTRRGDAALKDLGNRLVDKSYVLVIDLSNLQTMDEAVSEDMKGWKADVAAHLYRISMNDELRNEFYETWIYEDDPEHVKASKRIAFDNLDVPLNYVTTVNTSVRNTQSKRYGSKSEDVLLQELIQKAYDEALFNLEMEVDDFRVSTALFQKRPLRAKVGLKEGIKTDFRFFVYEHVYDSGSGSVNPVRRGVIRASSASKIHDNRHEAAGDMGTSVFYQVSGRRLHEGYTIVQKNDFGMEITLAGQAGEIGGASGRLDLRTGRFTGIRAFFVYVDLGIDMGRYPTSAAGIMNEELFTFLRASGGLAKGFQFTRNVELRP